MSDNVTLRCSCFVVCKIPNYNSVFFNIVMLYTQIEIRLYSNYIIDLGCFTVMEKVLTRIKSLIDAKGLTIFKLTELSGLSENTIYNWYNNGAEPSIRALKAICPHLEVTLSQLVADNDNEEITYQEKELINNFKKLSDSKKDIIVKLIKEMADN